MALLGWKWNPNPVAAVVVGDKQRGTQAWWSKVEFQERGPREQGASAAERQLPEPAFHSRWPRDLAFPLPGTALVIQHLAETIHGHQVSYLA